MKVIVLGGTGVYGQIISRRLAESELVSDLVITGRTLEKATTLASALGPRASGAGVDVFDETGLQNIVDGSDLIVNFTGPEYQTIIPVLQAAINAGVNYCDIGVDGAVAETAMDMHGEAEAAGITAIIGAGAAPGLFNMTALHALGQLDEPQAVHFGYCHKFEALIGSVREHYEQLGQGKKIPAVPAMYIHALTGKARQYRDGQLIDVDAYSDPRILPLFGDGGIEVYTFGSSEPITFSKVMPSLKQVTANIGFFPCELNQFVRQEILEAGPGGEEKAFRSMVEGFVKHPERLTDTARDDVSCGEVVCVDGIKNGKPMRCIAEPSWNSGAFSVDSVTVDPLMVTVNCILRGEVDATGVTSPEACLDPQMFFSELATMEPIVTAENDRYIRTRLEPLP